MPKALLLIKNMSLDEIIINKMRIGVRLHENRDIKNYCAQLFAAMGH